MARKIYAQVEAPNGTLFKIQATGQTWTLYFKEPSKKWKRIQSAVDAKFLYQVMMNQRDFRKMNEVVD